MIIHTSITCASVQKYHYDDVIYWYYSASVLYTSITHANVLMYRYDEYTSITRASVLKYHYDCIYIYI